MNPNPKFISGATKNIDTTAGIMIDSTGIIHETFKTGKENIVKEYGDKLGALRQKLLGT